MQRGRNREREKDRGRKGEIEKTEIKVERSIRKDLLPLGKRVKECTLNNLYKDVI